MFHNSKDDDDDSKSPKIKLPFGGHNDDDDDNAPFRPFVSSEKHSLDEARSILQRLIDWLRSEG